MQLDHIMFAANDLESGIRHVSSLTGVEAEFGGSHPGGGTCNALLSFGREQYLEIIAPDPAQTLKGTMGESLVGIERPFIRTWAAATSDFESLSARLNESGLGARVIDMSRTRPDGVHLAWQLLFVEGHSFGLAMPFFINWLDSTHPCVDAPTGCRLRSFTVQSPQAADFSAFCQAIDLEVNVESGSMLMQAELETPAGEVILN